MSSTTHNFSNRVVLITGATGGMGQAISRSMADASAQLVLTDLDADAGFLSAEDAMRARRDARR